MLSLWSWVRHGCSQQTQSIVTYGGPNPSLQVFMSQKLWQRVKEQDHAQPLMCHRWLLPVDEEEGIWGRLGWVLLEELTSCWCLSKKGGGHVSWGFACFWEGKKAEGQGFLAHRSAIYQVAQVEKVQELERTVRLSFPRWRGVAGPLVQMDWRKRLAWVGARWSLCTLSGESVEMAQGNMKMWEDVVLHRWWRHLSETGEIYVYIILLEYLQIHMYHRYNIFLTGKMFHPISVDRKDCLLIIALLKCLIICQKWEHSLLGHL